MKIKTFHEMEFGISADDLVQLLYRAKQGEIMFAENMANQEKIKRLKKEVGELMAKVENQRKEVINMAVKWTKPKKAKAKAEGEQPKADKPKADKPKADKPKGKKEAK